MSIKKSLGLGLVVGLLAMAFAALPAIASAAPALTSPSKTLVPVGTTITGTSTDAKTVFTGGAGTLTCEKVVIHGIVKKNNGTEVLVEMEESEVDTATGCKLAGVAVTVKPTFKNLTETTASKTAEFSFTVSPTGLSESSKSTVTCNTTNTDASSIFVKGTVGGTQAGTFEGNFSTEYTNAKGEIKEILFDC